MIWTSISCNILEKKIKALLGNIIYFYFDVVVYEQHLAHMKNVSLEI